jgi:hypothetical protein
MTALSIMSSAIILELIRNYDSFGAALTAEIGTATYRRLSPKIFLDNQNTPGVYIFAAAMTPLSKHWTYHWQRNQVIGLTEIDGTAVA